MSTRFNLPKMPNNAFKVLKVNALESDYFWSDLFLEALTLGSGANGVLDLDVSDPNNPILDFLKVFVDGTTITGKGIDGDPLVAIGGGGGLDTRAYSVQMQSNINTGQRSAFAGILGTSATEANVRVAFDEIMVVKKIAFRINTNTCNEDVTIILRKNGVDTAYSTTVAAGITGDFIFSTDETFSATDEISIRQFISGTATGGLIFDGNAYLIANVSGGSPLGVQSVSGANVDNTDPFNPIVNAVVKRIRKTITSAELLALHTTPIELIPTPGSGKYVRVITAASRMYGMTAAYSMTVPNADRMYVSLVSDTASANSTGFGQLPQFTIFSSMNISFMGLFGSTVQRIQAPAPPNLDAGASSDFANVVEDDPIMLKAFTDNATKRALITGDGDLDLDIIYEEVTI